MIIKNIFFVACLLITTLSHSVNFEIGPFNAYYYQENDGTTPGQGSDGSDPNIASELIAEELTPYPSINYSWNNLYGIDSYNFYGVWEGNIVVHDSIAVIQANFSLSWSDAKFYLDDELIHGWKNRNKDITLMLSKGTHHVRIEHHNHWHTTTFNVSFTNYPQFDLSYAATLDDIVNLRDSSADTKVVSINAYESGDIYNETTLVLPEHDGSIVLFLSSYRAINWLIENPHNTNIAGILFNSYEPGSNVQNHGEAPVYNITNFSRGYSDPSRSNSEILSLMGAIPDFVYGNYTISTIAIPSFE